MRLGQGIPVVRRGSGKARRDTIPYLNSCAGAFNSRGDTVSLYGFLVMHLRDGTANTKSIHIIMKTIRIESRFLATAAAMVAVLSLSLTPAFSLDPAIAQGSGKV